MAFKRISKNGFDGDQFKFEEEGTVLEGYYLGVAMIPIKGKDVPRYSFKTEAGVVSTLGSKNLNEGLEDAVQGAKTRVTFEEMSRTKAGNDFKRFTVEQDQDDILKEMPALSAPQASASKPAAGKTYQGSSVASKAAELKGQLNKTIA